MKECIKCHHILPLTNEFFGIRTDSPDGFRNDCKECVKKRRDAWHIKNRDDQLQKMKEYRLDHRDHLISVQREYNKENRDMIIKRCHIYYESNRDNILAQM